MANHPQIFAQPGQRKIYSVSEVNRLARESLEEFNLWVRGEIAELEGIRSKSGVTFHKFKLKDLVNEYTLPCLVWPEDFDNFSFPISNGLEVVCFGNLTLYEKQGIYQFQVTAAELTGEGELARRFELLKKKLREGGLFDEKFKKPIPTFPVKIGVITSETGAAWTDFVKNSVEKFPFLQIYLADVFVQGEQAIGDICWAIESLNRQDVEVIVLTRGGGSLEDLAAFNSEEVARAIFASQIPVIAAVGHERDETIADWAADFRASTPTAAAKILVSSFEEFIFQIDHLEERLKNAAEKVVKLSKLELASCEQNFNNAVGAIVLTRRVEFDNLIQSFLAAARSFFEGKKNYLQNLAIKLKLLSPEKILARGYSVTYSLPENKILKTTQTVKVGSYIKVRLWEGKLKGAVTEVENGARF